MGASRSRPAPPCDNSIGLDIELMIGANLFNFCRNDKTAFQAQTVAGCVQRV
jgi:hypothetical protein